MDTIEPTITTVAVSEPRVASQPTATSWSSAVRLAVVVSFVAALVAVAASLAGVPHTVVVLTVIAVAFALSWLRTA